MNENSKIAAESVGKGHPDKICDIISDTIVDAYLSIDDNAHVAVETLVSTDLVIVCGEVLASASISNDELDALIRKTIFDIGYKNSELGFSDQTVEIINRIHKQSSDINQGIHQKVDEIGAGDQGIIYGYATNEGPNYYPLAKSITDKIIFELTKKRESGDLPWALPDMKSQVVINYQIDDLPLVDTIVVSIMHCYDANLQECRLVVKKIVDNIINDYVSGKYLSKKCLNFEYILLFNPTGRFVIGGPNGDTGLTGRKIIVDSYGGVGRHGGGAYSGKDYTKVDRSGAYAARWAAKNVVAAGLAKECEIQLSYAIGVSQPTSVHISTNNTGVLSDEELLKVVQKCFVFTPYNIINNLKLKTPIYAKTAVGSHFNNFDQQFTWENLDKVNELKRIHDVICKNC